MNKRGFTLIEWFYWLVRGVFGGLSTPARVIADWATVRLNNSYYGVAQATLPPQPQPRTETEAPDVKSE